MLSRYDPLLALILYSKRVKEGECERERKKERI
jgi:hypothetical protein